MPQPPWTGAESSALRTIILEVCQDGERMDWKTIEEKYAEKAQESGFPERSVGALKGKWSRMNEPTQEVYLPQFSYGPSAGWHAGLYPFVTDVHQTIYPAMPVAQVPAPGPGAAIQSPYYNIPENMAFPARTGFGAYPAARNQQQNASFTVEEAYVHTSADAQQSQAEEHSPERGQGKPYVWPSQLVSRKNRGS